MNWSGGGQLKEGGEKWDVDTLTEVAVRFPDLVAVREHMHTISKWANSLTLRCIGLPTAYSRNTHQIYRSSGLSRVEGHQAREPS